MSRDETVVGNSDVKKLEKRVRELEYPLGKKTMEAEILREVLELSDQKKRHLRLPLLPKEPG